MTSCSSMVETIVPADDTSKAQVVSAQSDDIEVYEFFFGEDRVTFCSEGGPMDHGESMVAIGRFGYETPSDAVAAHEAYQRDAASNPKIPEELRKMLGPARETKYTRSTYRAPDGQAFFDVTSKGPADLEARIVVSEFPGDGWKITETFACMSVAVTDVERYNQLAEEIYSR